MRISTRLGLGLVLAGLAVLVVSTGGFDSIAADRGSQLDTAGDPNALLGISTPEGRPVALENGSPGCWIFIFPTCTVYEDVDVVRFADNTASGGLSVADITFVTDDSDSNFDITAGPSSETGGPDLAIVTASFECDGYYFGQQQGSGWIEVDATVTDGDTTIEATRRSDVECVPE
jgi:hypothetical protein